jgi:hypothetical protein
MVVLAAPPPPSSPHRYNSHFRMQRPDHPPIRACRDPQEGLCVFNQKHLESVTEIASMG